MQNREIEVKFQIDDPKKPWYRTQRLLEHAGFSYAGPAETRETGWSQDDIYLPSGPDDTIRLRVETSGGKVKRLLTTKTPGTGPDGHSTRYEKEEEIGELAFETLHVMGSLAGTVLGVSKTRRAYVRVFQNAEFGELHITACIDLVYNLRDDRAPSQFVEWECLQPGDASDEQVAGVLAYLIQLSSNILGTGEPEKQSYKKLAKKAAERRAAAAAKS